METVIREPPNLAMPGGDYIIYIASQADEIAPWGSAPAQRDRVLRQFWPTEPIFASALFSTASRYAGFSYNLKGPDRTVGIVQRLLANVEFGQGWQQLLLKTYIDLATQDNGAFIEVVRTSDSPNAPAISLNHLDSNRCTRTGKRDTPVVYYDYYNNPHLMKWYQIVPLAEFPSPIERYYGMQYCTLTRMLRAAQILRDISVYKREKIGGRFNRAIYFVGGIQSKTIETALKNKAIQADQQGLNRYIDPVIIASLDPTANVKVDSIELASLPDQFNEETAMKWYVNQLALAFGGDYQDFAPLPAGNLGTSEQSETLHLKSRGKGPRLFMLLIEKMMNYFGVLPATVEFSYGDQDIAENIENANLRLTRARERAERIKSGELTPEVARQIAVDNGDLDPRMLPVLAASDAKLLAEANAAARQQQPKPMSATDPTPEVRATN